MPADASLPPQPLSAHAVGEVALDYDRSKPGSDRIAWGEMEPKHRMLMGQVINDGKWAYLTDRTLLLADPESDPASKVTFIETYDFIDEGKSILFFTVEKGRPFNGIYKLDIATGKTSPMPTDAQHNETHSFPNVLCGWLPRCKWRFDDLAYWSGAVLCPACWCSRFVTAGPDGIRELGPTLLCRL